MATRTLPYDNTATAISGTSRALSSNIPDPSAYEKFNANLMSFLMQAQANPALGTAKFQRAASEGRQQMAEAGFKPLSPELQAYGFSPNQIQGIRGAQAGTAEPQARANEQMAQTYGEQIQSTMGGIRDVLEQSRLTTEKIQQQKQQARQDALDFIDRQFNTFGSQAFLDASPEELIQLEKTAGIPSGYLSRRRMTLTEQEQQNKVSSAPSSYQEWSLAGGLEGTGLTYADFLKGGKTKTSIDNADFELSNSVGPGGFIDINDYKRIRNQYSQAGFTSADFDKQYANQYLSPSDRSRFNISGGGATPGQIIDQQTGKPADVPSNISQKVATLNSFISNQARSINRIKELLNDKDVNMRGLTNYLQGLAYGKPILGTLSGLNEKEKELANLIKIVGNDYLYARSGAQINESEYNRLKNTLPEFGYSKSDNITKLNNWENQLKNIINDTLSIYGAKIQEGNNQSSQAGPVRVSTPQGTFEFPDQASADAFRQKAGLN